MNKPMSKIMAASLSVLLGVTMIGIAACGESEEDTSYTVTFNANGGSYSSGETVTVETDSSGKVTLPDDPTRTDYTFSGYNTSASGSGSAVTASTVYTADTTVYAQWTASTGGDGDETVDSIVNSDGTFEFDVVDGVSDYFISIYKYGESDWFDQESITVTSGATTVSGDLNDYFRYAYGKYSIKVTDEDEEEIYYEADFTSTGELAAPHIGYQWYNNELTISVSNWLAYYYTAFPDSIAVTVKNSSGSQVASLTISDIENTFSNSWQTISGITAGDTYTIEAVGTTSNSYVTASSSTTYSVTTSTLTSSEYISYDYDIQPTIDPTVQTNFFLVNKTGWTCVGVSEEDATIEPVQLSSGTWTRDTSRETDYFKWVFTYDNGYGTENYSQSLTNARLYLKADGTLILYLSDGPYEVVDGETHLGGEDYEIDWVYCYGFWTYDESTDTVTFDFSMSQEYVPGL